MAHSRRDFLRQAACLLGGVSLASTFESFGLVSALAGEAAEAADYRALVCVFLNGGNDSNNTIVPLDGEYAAYSSVRGGAGLAIPQASLLPVNPASGRQFGLHPNLVELQSLFNQQKLAVVCNTGPLVEPLTRSSYLGGGRRPYQLFSHSDQVNQWQNAIATGPSQTGWGGRLADRVAPQNGAATFPQVVSIAGISLFVTGVNARPLAISDSNTQLSRVLPLNLYQSGASVSPATTYTSAEVQARRLAFDQLRGYDLSTSLVKASSDITSQALATSAALASSDSTLTTAFPNTSLGRQLLQVARLVKANLSPADPTKALNMKRQIFFVSIGGFDNHNNQGTTAGNHPTLLLQVSQAMKAFYDATVELGVQNEVTTFTISDFGRTFKPAGTGAGVGSDHGWGGHHFVMGGSVRGGDFYGRFPTLALGGPDDTDTSGRWIPSTSVEQYAATLATWYGLPSSDLSYAFPLVNRFASANLGFML